MIHHNHISPSWLYWPVFLLVLLALPAQAAIIAPRNLYEGEIRVDSQNSAAREALIRQALGQVLVRITGDREITKHKAGIDLMKIAARLVQQYDYDRRPAPPVKGARPTVPVPAIMVFRARFDAQQIDSQLRERGLPVWGRERPVTQVWLGVQAEGSRWLLSEGVATVETPSLLQAALARGVPLALPATTGASELQDVMQGATDKLIASAQSAGHKYVLVGRVTQKGAQWNGSWMLLDSSGQVQDKWQGTAVSREEAFAFGIEQMANAYAARYALRGGVAIAIGGLRLQVSGVDTVDDYARVSKYLAGLSIVTGVELVEMASGRASYDLRLRGDRINMQQAIALSSVLKPESGPTAEAADAPLSYQLVK